jgi:hypothetical protein
MKSLYLRDIADMRDNRVRLKVESKPRRTLCPPGRMGIERGIA